MNCGRSKQPSTKGLRCPDARYAREAGASLTEVIIGLSLSMVFAASALSAFVLNQRYSVISAYNSQANRLNQAQAEHLLNTNYASITNFAVTNYDFSISRRSDVTGPTGGSAGSTVRTFTTRPGSQWRTNVSAAIAFETEVTVSNRGSYLDVLLCTYWEHNGRYMSNQMVISRAKDNE